MRIEKSCPLPRSHNRLRQVHDLWHEMESAYADADEFVTKLNACIQAARSVTWVLQKEAKDADGFASFYATQQNFIRSDARMRWLVEARNVIEKQGDLDTDSVAAVSLALTDQEVLIKHFDVPPLTSPQQAAAAIRVGDLPDRVRRQAVMVVERRWTVVELPGDELLDVLGHCYGVLATVVSEAHELCGIQMRSETACKTPILTTPCYRVATWLHQPLERRRRTWQVRAERPTWEAWRQLSAEHERARAAIRESLGECGRAVSRPG